MQSAGGTLDARHRAAQARPPDRVRPRCRCDGVLATSAGSPAARSLISLDMGGTTAKAAIVEDGQPVRTSEYEVGAGINLSSKLVKGGGHPIKLPFIDVSEIGAGGGSIVAIDELGTVSVGPVSAGLDPGPACYGLGGTEPTLTDALLALGYLDDAHARRRRDHARAGRSRARRSSASWRRRSAARVEEAAHGILHARRSRR